eukprot:8272065-Ditylum_brightwellii.AAC.1
MRDTNPIKCLKMLNNSKAIRKQGGHCGRRAVHHGQQSRRHKGHWCNGHNCAGQTLVFGNMRDVGTTDLDKFLKEMSKK